MKSGTSSGKYVGTPLFGGACRSTLWKDLVDCCVCRMDGWKSKWLTSASRILMFKSVILAIPIFSMMCLKIP